MANINALIAAGPHTRGFDVKGALGGIEALKYAKTRNALADITLQNAPAAAARAEAQENRLQSQENRAQATEDRAQAKYESIESLRQGISLVRFLDKNDIEGAINYVSQDGVTENEQRVIDMLQSGDPAQIEALKTGTKGLIETALLVGDIKQPTPTKRESYVAADKYRRFVDDQSRVFPDVEAAPEGVDGKEAQIAESMRLYPDLSHQDAFAVAHKTAKIETDELGVTRYTNLLDPTDVRILSAKAPRHVNVETPVSDTIYAAAGEGTGIWNAASRLIARTASQAGFDPKFAEEEFKAETLMNTVMRDVQQSFGLSPKHPVAQQKLIEEYYPLIASWRKDPEVYKAEITPLAGVLSRAIAQSEIDTLESTDPEVKQAAQTQARSMRKLLNTLGIPLEKIEDVRSYAMAYEEGFWDWTYERQEEFIAMKTKEQQWLQGKLNESN